MDQATSETPAQEPKQQECKALVYDSSKPHGLRMDISPVPSIESNEVRECNLFENTISALHLSTCSYCFSSSRKNVPDRRNKTNIIRITKTSITDPRESQVCSVQSHRLQDFRATHHQLVCWSEYHPHFQQFFGWIFGSFLLT